MDKATKSLSNFISNKGIALTHLSKKTGIPYYTLYQSLSPISGVRSLRAEEFLKLCKELEVDPFKFYSNSLGA